MNLARIRIVLVRTSHSGNIGACARAMKNMGLTRLTLVACADESAPDALARAAGADDLLANAEKHETLESALAGCVLAVGSSARERAIAWPALDPEAAAHRLIAKSEEGEVALVFGAERTGLTNEELDLCQFVVTIPADPSFSSLNLAAAVQVLTYELYCAAKARSSTPAQSGASSRTRPATNMELQNYYEHLERVLVAIQFLDPDNPRKLMRRLTRLYNRAMPDANEINILRGILTEVERQLSRRS